MPNDDDKTQEYDGDSYRYSSKWIAALESEQHWRLYWRQQYQMRGRVLPGQRVLEIGVGTGFTANYLRAAGVDVVTLDIDTAKHPDIVANVASYEFSEAFDHILAYEVFEHIPFRHFERILHRLSGSCRNYLFLSVPRNERVILEFNLRLFGSRERRFALCLAGRRPLSTGGHHHWEVDHPMTPRWKFEAAIQSAGFSPSQRAKEFSRLFYVLQSPLLRHL